jgi:hypothetical protein
VKLPDKETALSQAAFSIVLVNGDDSLLGKECGFLLSPRSRRVEVVESTLHLAQDILI